MSFVIAQPKALVAAAGNLPGICAAISAADGAAATPTTRVVPAVAGDMSAPTGAKFTVHAQMYKPVSAGAQAIHQILVSALEAGVGSYAATGAARAIKASRGAGGSPMDFGALTPEINSTRMYAGPGSVRMLPAWLPQC